MILIFQPRVKIPSRFADKIFKRRVHSFTNIHAAHCCSLFIGDTHAFLTTWLFRFDPNLLFWWHSLLWLPNRFYWIFLAVLEVLLKLSGKLDPFGTRPFFAVTPVTFLLSSSVLRWRFHSILVQCEWFVFVTDWILVGKILVVQNFWFVGLIQNLLEEFCYWLFCVLLWTSLVIWTF